MDKINPIEKRMLPEFFGTSATKTAELYLKYRNYMVHAYRQQPSVYLTATACRRNLAGDACAILRVHEFLTHWGLINFHVPPHGMPPALHSTYALKTVEATSARHEQGPVAMFTAGTTDSARRTNVPLACDLCGTARGPNCAFFELVPDVKTRVMCNGTTAATSGTVPPASGKDKEVTLGGVALRPGSGICEPCYLHGAFPDDYEASDFQRMPTPVSTSSDWTENETRAMLEAVSTTTDDPESNCDWYLVATKVGTKTAQECLLHFLELPLLEKGHGLTEPVNWYTPGQACNTPVVDLEALVAQVDPFVAKAAAHAAMKAIERLHRMPIVDSVPVEKLEEATRASTVLEAASKAVGTSAETAGIAVPIKSEEGDGAMVPKSADESGSGTKATQAMLAVTEETARATTVALLATRAHALAEETANVPIRDLVHQLQANQLRQLELKMAQLDVLQHAIVAEKEQVAQAKYELYVERLAFAHDKLNGRMP